MALDPSSNWTVAMSKGKSVDALAPDCFKPILIHESSRNMLPPKEQDEEWEHSTVSSSYSSHLPSEILLHILDHVVYSDLRQRQCTLWAATLVSRSWYTAAVSFLYESPILNGKNYDKFVSTICPSINPHVRRSRLASMVHYLDMGHIVHNGSKSLTARLLGRVKGSLEGFRAPMAPFGFNCLPALAKCYELKTLDLSLVSESIPLSSLFHALVPLSSLRTLHFPRSSSSALDTNKHSSNPPQWPPNLQELYITGGLHENAWLYLSCLPQSLGSLTIENCLTLSSQFVEKFLVMVGPQLNYLKIGYPLPWRGPSFVNDILEICPCLRSLNVAMDFINHAFFDKACRTVSTSHPLASLTLTSSEKLLVDDVLCDLLFFAVSDGSLGNLRRVKVSKNAGWSDGLGRKGMEELNELLEALGRENGQGELAGVWEYEEGR
ncbi:hypothetical protein MMC14_000089 [Varicellaria rhodocarpa]|nr:hypothetical protein [Varicellaria rhodocarpa]